MAAKMVYFEWVDAVGNSGWFSPDDTSPPMQCQALGFVVKETKEYVTIAPGVTADGQYMGYVTVPKGWIKKRKVVKL